MKIIRTTVSARYCQIVFQINVTDADATLLNHLSLLQLKLN